MAGTRHGHDTEYLFLLLLPSVDDTLEVSSLQGSTADESTVDVGLSEELRSIAGLAAATLEDSSVLSSLFAVLVGNDRTDVS